MIIFGDFVVEEILQFLVFEFLFYMKGGLLVDVLLDFVLGEDKDKVKKFVDVLKIQVFFYEVDMEWLEYVFKSGNEIVREILLSYVQVEFFMKFFEVEEEIQVVIYIVVEGDILIDLLLFGN